MKCKRFSGIFQFYKSTPSGFIYLVLFLIAFIPRTLALDAYVAPDEGKWIYRSAHFLQAFLDSDLARMTSVAATPDVEVLAPAVPTMWTGAAGLAAKYWIDGAFQSVSLSDYLDAIPNKTEKIPLDFYPWTRFPTVLLTSLSILIFYYLGSKLVGRRVALIAALLLALDPFFVGLSRVIHHDALVSIFIMISLLTLLVYQQASKSRLWLILSGIAGGLALLTKPTALYLVIFVGLFLMWETIRQGKGSASADFLGFLRSFVLDAIIWSVTALITFVVVWPAMWVAPIDTLTALLDRATNAIDGGNDYSLIPTPGNPLPELGFLFYPINWLFKATLPLLLGLAALIVSWWRGWIRQYAVHDSHPQKSTWASKWLTAFVFLFLLLLIPAGTRDIRYFLPATPALYGLATVGILAFNAQPRLIRHLSPLWIVSLLLIMQLSLTIIYYPYFVDYYNPVIGGPWLAPNLVKVGSGEGLDQMGRYLSGKPNGTELTVATSFWESFVPFFSGHYTKAHYDDEADYILIYRRQIQNRNPFPEYWTYFSARRPEYKVTLVGLDYAWLYPGPQLRVVRNADFGDGLALRGYRLERPAAQPGQTAHLTLVWAGATPAHAHKEVVAQLIDTTGQLWTQASGSLLDANGPSSVEGHYALEIPAHMPRGDYELWVSIETGPVGQMVHQVGMIPIRQLDKPGEDK